jgi:SAM-dependent methyltransferase
MGIDWNMARFLVAARNSGVVFDRTATIGRHNVFVEPTDIESFFREFHVEPCINYAAVSRSGFADELFAALGATVCTSIDASSYEGASEVHDMNYPIPDRLRNSFDVVVDGGTLEHVFNFPTAIRNCMELVRVGGHLLLQTPANNYFGHGFYQFSPELFYRVLSPDNGFSVERMIAYEAYAGSQWYEVTDPAILGSRVELIGSRQRVLLLIRAQRTHECTIFAKPPMQSDYVVAWADGQSLPNQRATKADGLTEPHPLRQLAWKAMRLCGLVNQRTIVEQRHWLYNRQFLLNAQPEAFRPVDK